MKIAFQGERGAYSELAAKAFFNSSVGLLPLPRFKDVFNAVKSGKAYKGILPIENSLAGSIHENYDSLLKYKLHITGEVKLRISHNLIALKGEKLSEISKIYSHPQALSQCSNYLASMKNTEQVPFADTAGAAQYIKENKIKGAAAIASSQAAKDYRMNILKRSIEDNNKNYTRFIILSKTKGRTPKGTKMKTSIVFSLKNMPGALFKSLSVFALRDIDLFKIESRPLHGRLWKYLFYLDFQGSIKQKKSRLALEHLNEIANFVQILGSYPVGPEIRP
ncbi:MAG: prephenate dehydratase [Fibrobacterota bacterium]